MGENEGEDKVVSLQEAIKRNVKEGAKIHIGITHCSPLAAVLEIARQFFGKKPNFTLIVRGVRDTTVILIHMGLVKKVITTFSGNVYPCVWPQSSDPEGLWEKRDRTRGLVYPHLTADAHGRGSGSRFHANYVCHRNHDGSGQQGFLYSNRRPFRQWEEDR